MSILDYDVVRLCLKCPCRQRMTFSPVKINLKNVESLRDCSTFFRNFAFMKKTDKIISLVIVLLMVAVAAITVNKSLLGHGIQQSEAGATEQTGLQDPITVSDGKTVIHTHGMDGTIAGYAGPVPLDIYISDGKIVEIEPLQNAESPNFFKRAEALFDQWIGKTPEEALAMKVDAVSGATFSSNAIISNVDAGLAYYQGSDHSSKTSVPVKIYLALAVTLAACIVPLFVSNKIYRNAQLIANVIVLGFWTGQFLDYALILKYASQGFTWPIALIAIVMLIAAFIYPLFGHPQHYCNHICPLGSAQQLMAKVCGYKIKISPKVLKGLDWFRKILWASLMLLLWADCLTGWMDLELFQAFQFESASWGIIIAAVLFVVLSAVVARPYCRFVCPTGSLFKRSENIG